MSSRDQLRLASEIALHLDIEDIVTFHVLVSWRRIQTVLNVKGYSNVLHFLVNDVSPEGVALFFINFKCSLHCLGYFEPKFVSLLGASFIDSRDEAIAFLEHVRYLPCKCKHGFYTIVLCVFHNLYRV